MENKEILTLINKEPMNTDEIENILSKTNIADIAEIFGNIDEEDKDKLIALYRALPKNLAADVFAYMNIDGQQIIVEAISDAELEEILNHLFVDDTVDFIEELPDNVVSRVFKHIHPEKKEHIDKIMQHPENSAGSIMTTEYVSLSEEETVKEAFDHIRSIGVNKETIYTCYVVGKDKVLVGVITAKTLLLSNPEERIGYIMKSDPVFARTTDDREEVARLFRKYGFLAMPVVDQEQKLVGIITVDDIMHVIEKENTEDIEKMHALTPSDEPYLKTNIFRLARNRFTWLLVLMLSATITGTIMASYEEALSTLPILMAFIPMIMGTGGNAGCQASTLIIRGMALGEIKIRDVLRVFWRELRVATLCSLGLCVINFIRIYLMHDGDLMLSFAVTASLFFTIVMAKSVGCILPITVKLIKIDPALVASPLLTTIVDGTSLIIYFTIARAVFNM